jgi:sugar phosphate isomerase/epimerase
MFADLTIEQVCEQVAQLDLQALDIWCPFGPCKHLDDVRDRLGGKGLKSLLARHRLQLCAFSVYGVGLRPYATLLRDVGGGIAVRESRYGKSAPGEMTSQLRAFFEGLKPDIDLAGEIGARLAIENHGDALLDSIDSLKAFVDLNPAPEHVGIALAPYHLQARRDSVEEAIRTCGSQLLFFYAWQKAEDLAQLPGHGPTDFGPWLEALAGIRYPHHVTLFMHGHPPTEVMAKAVARSRDYIRNRLQPRHPGA